MLTAVTGTALFQSTLGEDQDTLIIGDQQAPQNFAPILAFPKWRGEVNFGLDLTAISTLGVSFVSPSVSVGRIISPSGPIQFFFQDDGVENFKFGLILNSKPPVNTVSFALTGVNDLNFYFQPYLANVNPDGSSWEPTSRGGRKDRPAGVGGGYAVFHKTKANYILGETNYKCGQVGFFYCPKFTDSAGHSVWATLSIAGTVYKITLPQNFLNTATYPITCNDTFGYTTQGASSTPVGINYTEFGQINALSPAGGGTLTNLSVCISTSSSPTCKFAWYSETTAHPSTRRAVDALAWTPGASKAFATNPVAWSFSLAASTQYWGGCGQASSGTLDVYYTSTGGYILSYGAGVCVDPAVVGGDDDTSSIPSYYATYTAAGGTEYFSGMNLGINRGINRGIGGGRVT